MADKSLTFNVFGKDVSASRTIKGVGNEAQSMGKAFGKTTSLIGAGLGALGIAAAGTKVVDFLHDSVDAYRDAEVQQTKLEDAYKRFPAVTNVSIDALREYNHQLSYKVGYDDDAIASSQAVIAAFGLTGDQVKGITPLIVDYAAKTGQDLPTAAGAMGKALLGSTKALKTLGIEGFKPTGDRAHDVDTLVGLLQKKIGGFAEQAASTDSGKLQVLQTRFGDLQEEIGGKLVPVFSGLVDYVSAHVMPTLDDLGQAKGIDEFFAAIEKHSKSGDTFGFLDTSAWAHGFDQIKQYMNGGQINPAGSGGPLDPVAWQQGWNQLMGLLANGFAQLQATVFNGANWANGWTQMMGALGNGWNQLTAGMGGSWDVWMGRFANGRAQIDGWFETTLPNSFANGWGQLMARFSSGWAQIQGAFANGAGQIVGAFSNGWSQISAGWSGLIGRFSNGWGQIVAGARGLGTQFYSVGTSIVQGMINGVTAWIGRAVASVASLAAKMLDAAKGALGIHSPSRVFRDEVGAQIGAGVVAGITGSQSDVASAVANLVPVPSVSTSGGVAGGVLGSGSGEVHLHFHGAVLDNAAKFGKAAYDAMVDARRQGAIPRDSFVTP